MNLRCQLPSKPRSFVLLALIGMLGSGPVMPTMVWASATVPAASVSAAPARIVVRPAILVDQARIDASHLAGGMVNDQVREALAKIPVGMIAQPLGEIALDRADLERKLGSFASLFELPERLQIRRRGELLPGAELETRIRQAVSGRDPAIPLSELRIDCSRLPKNVVLPGTIESWQVTPMSNNLLGMCIFALDATCQNGKVRQILQVEVTREVAAAKVKRLLKRGSCVSAEDLMIETVRITSGHAQVPLTSEQVVGRLVGVYKSPGSFLRATDLVADGAAVPAGADQNNGLQKATNLGLDKVCSVQTGDSPILSRVKKAKVEAALEAQEKAAGLADLGDPELASIGAETGSVPASQLKTFPGEVGNTMAAPARTPVADKISQRAGPMLGRNLSSAMSGPIKITGVSKKDGWVIKPGDQVDFTVKRGGLTLSVPARALDGGAEGTSIRLVNLQNQRQIQGVITGKGMVEYAE